MSRKKAVLLVGLFGFLLGFPSAVSMEFFNNQDWVWGLGLMVSGFFFTIAVIKFGPKNFRVHVISSADKKIKLGKGFEILVTVLLFLKFPSSNGLVV